MKWISIEERMPDLPGLYRVKTSLNEKSWFKTFCTRNALGELIFLVLDKSNPVTHWAEIELPKQQ